MRARPISNASRQSVRILLDDFDGVWAVGLEDANRLGGRDAMGVKKDHDAANDLLVGPAGGNLLGAHFADAGNVAQTLGRLFDDVEDSGTEGFDEFAGIHGADALDHARTQIAFDAGERGRWRDRDELRLELAAMFAIGHPLAAGTGVFARCDGRGMANQGEQFALPLDLEAQDAEPVLCVVVGHPLDQASDAFKLGGYLGGI